jgi:Na+-translocating ferredoxin:NAD+ oxidoreductase RnfG subunit
MKLKTIVTVLFSIILLMSFGIPENLEKKVDREVKDVFEIDSYKFEKVIVSEEIKSKIPSKIDDENFFRINSKEKIKGYVYVDKAPSKTADFDYLVIFDHNLKIARTKVLIYREEYGGEIGSKRWLRQFTGKSSEDSLDDIAAISGATISVRSMTNAVKDILKTMKILQIKKVI